MKAPEGATHFHYFYGHVTFWCVKDTEYSREHAKWYGRWHYWDRGVWVADRTASSRGFQPIAEYCEATYGV